MSITKVGDISVYKECKRGDLLVIFNADVSQGKYSAGKNLKIVTDLEEAIKICKLENRDSSILKIFKKGIYRFGDLNKDYVNGAYIKKCEDAIEKVIK